MSQENVEIVRRYMEGFGRQSPESMGERMDAFWDPEGDYYPVRKFPESRPCHGLEEISRFAAEFRAVWERLEYDVRELFPVGDDRVLARARMSAEGGESGPELEGDHYVSAWLRHGRFIRVEDHLTLAGALHALGLSGDSLQAAGLRE
jgi:SnoaL-like protein